MLTEMMKLEGEIPNFFMVWILVVASLSYCHTVGNLTSPGTTRLLAILPVVFFFFYLPLNLTTIFLGGPSSFFLAWLANFKLLLFAFNKGPLATTPPTSIYHFIPLACLPIKFRNDPKTPEKKTEHPAQRISNSKSLPKGQKSTLNYVIKALIFATSVQVYHKKQFIHPKILLFLYSIYMYTGLELILALVASLARVFLGVDFEPQFDEPYLATSLQDFWGRRWNIMVSKILHPTVYEPIRKISTRAIGRKLAPLPAVLASFFVSAVMHELIFYYIGRKWPTWELTCFFLLHGICLAVEIEIKKAFDGKWRLPAAVSGPLAMAFVVATGVWLFLPSLMVRCEADAMAYREYTAFTEFMKSVSNFVKVNSSFLIVAGK
ncbi:long-chain-alcohol O-fatty-acyltransferase-like [Pyrus communis]|uniref:long-chain-alcohol O-fatty-acyltransferase-like n=1 Tax=Pyrus communis TaxID=23211 RepID=UPI0035C0A772